MTPRRVFLVEDEVILLMMLEDLVADLGHTVAGTALRVDEAIQLAETIEADCAILDVNLDGQQSFPVADVLAARGIPFVFATGYGSRGLERKYERCRTLQKPMDADALAAAITALAAQCGAPDTPE